MRLAAFEPMAMAGALVLPETIAGMIEQSMTLRFSTPRTRRRASTTDIGSASGPMRSVPTGW